MKTFAQKNWPDIAEKAVAYQLNFVSMAYGYNDDVSGKFFKPCCENNRNLSVHFMDFEYPKSKATSRPYLQLGCFFYAVSEELKNAILEFGIDDKEEDVFRPVWTRKHNQPICYSIEPKHIIKPIAKENDLETEIICSECDVVWAHRRDDDYSFWEYNGSGRPVYISKEVLDDFHDFNYTYEYHGPGGYLVREVIVSKRIYDFIINLYPRAEFRPVLIKEEPVETEEMKQKRLRDQRLREWRESLKQR